MFSPLHSVTNEEQITRSISAINPVNIRIRLDYPFLSKDMGTQKAYSLPTQSTYTHTHEIKFTITTDKTHTKITKQLYYTTRKQRSAE